MAIAWNRYLVGNSSFLSAKQRCVLCRPWLITPGVLKRKARESQACETFVTSECGRCRQEDLEFKVILSHKMSSRPSLSNRGHCPQKQTNKKPLGNMTRRSPACSRGKGARCQLQGREWGFWVPHSKRRKHTPEVCPLSCTGAQWHICPHKINNNCVVNPKTPKQNTQIPPPITHTSSTNILLTFMFVLSASIFFRLGNCFRLENSSLGKYVEEDWSWGHMGLDERSPWLGRLAHVTCCHWALS